MGTITAAMLREKTIGHKKSINKNAPEKYFAPKKFLLA